MSRLAQDTCVNIMSQHWPMCRAFDFPEIARPITRREHEEAVASARRLGLTNLDVQGRRG
jgi:uncharacterized Fe-S radical SAM superfamily protein PflX